MSPEEEQEMSPEEEQEVPPQEEQALSPEEEASIEAAQQQQPEASPEWPEEEQEGDLEIVTVGQQEYFRTSNNGLFTVIRDEEGNPDIGSWAGVLSDDGTQVVETEQPEEP
jgi:ATP-dependent exoDNAse (exonuclease V) alpha subunit